MTFSALDALRRKIERGLYLVIGNRFAGGIKTGAMPPLHRYFGNPLLTAIGPTLLSEPRQRFYADCAPSTASRCCRLDLTSPGMEFALEMIVKSTDQRSADS